MLRATSHLIFCRKKLSTTDKNGNTALHVAADYNQGEAMKLILRANTSLALVPNNQGKTPLDLANENKFHLCIELVSRLSLCFLPTRGQY